MIFNIQYVVVRQSPVGSVKLRRQKFDHILFKIPRVTREFTPVEITAIHRLASNL
jgi:hypothetical protein